MWGHTGALMLHVGISYSFEKKEIIIVDYIKPSPVYQVKCKLVIIGFAFTLRSYLWVLIQLVPDCFNLVDERTLQICLQVPYHYPNLVGG